MYREEIKVLDCTIRDGGLINNYQFTDDFVKAVYKAACLAGVDIIELGKKLCVSDEYTREKFGKWNFCDDDDLKAVNTCKDPENVVPAARQGATVEGGSLRALLEPASWNVIRLGEAR